MRSANVSEGDALAQCVRHARAERGLRQEDLARAAGIGTSTLRAIESGRGAGTSVFTVMRILAVTGRTVHDLDQVFVAASQRVAPSVR